MGITEGDMAVLMCEGSSDEEGERVVTAVAPVSTMMVGLAPVRIPEVSIHGLLRFERLDCQACRK